MSEGAGFQSLGSGPWLCRIRDGTVGLIVLGNLTSTSFNAPPPKAVF